jgi:hypothetical protein
MHKRRLHQHRNPATHIRTYGREGDDEIGVWAFLSGYCIALHWEGRNMEGREMIPRKTKTCLNMGYYNDMSIFMGHGLD